MQVITFAQHYSIISMHIQLGLICDTRNIIDKKPFLLFMFLLEHRNTVTIPMPAAHAVHFTGHDGVLAILHSHKTKNISRKTPYQARVLKTSSIQVHA